jgi:Flp pilus assembly protein TadG
MRASRRKPAAGQSLLEFAIILPLLFVLIVNVVNFAGMILAWMAVQNAARAGAQYLVMAGATVGPQVQPAAANVASLVRADLTSLPNSGTAQVGVCLNNNGTVTCSGTGTPPADPEPTVFVSASVDVTYSYRPLAGSWLMFGIRSSPFASAAQDGSISIHRRAAMRVLQ